MEQVIFFSSNVPNIVATTTVKCLNENESLHKHLFIFFLLLSTSSFVADFAMMKSYVHRLHTDEKNSLSHVCLFLLSISMLNKFFALFLKRQQKKTFLLLIYKFQVWGEKRKKKKIACVVFGIDERGLFFGHLNT